MAYADDSRQRLRCAVIRVFVHGVRRDTVEADKAVNRYGPRLLELLREDKVSGLLSKELVNRAFLDPLCEFAGLMRHFHSDLRQAQQFDDDQMVNSVIGRFVRDPKLKVTFGHLAEYYAEFDGKLKYLYDVTKKKPTNNTPELSVNHRYLIRTGRVRSRSLADSPVSAPVDQDYLPHLVEYSQLFWNVRASHHLPLDVLSHLETSLMQLKLDYVPICQIDYDGVHQLLGDIDALKEHFESVRIVSMRSVVPKSSRRRRLASQQRKLAKLETTL